MISMKLTHKQKKYLKKNLRKKSLRQIAQDLNLDPQVLQKDLEKKKSKKWLTDKFLDKKQENDLDKRIKDFNLKSFIQENRYLILLLCLLVLFTFFNSLKNDFVSDDINGILKNANLDNLSYIYSSPMRLIRFFQPFLYFLINSLFGRSPIAFRLVNLFFHLATVQALFLILYLLFNRRIALVAATLLAVHPIVTESVVWISGSGYVMYSFFLLLSILAFLFISKNKKYLYYSFAFGTIAVLISEKALIFPLILGALSLTYDIQVKNKKKLLLIAVPVAVLGLILLSQVPERISSLQSNYYAQNGITNPFVQIPVAISSYLRLIFWPKNLTLYHTDLTSGYFTFPLMLVVFLAFMVLLIASFKKNRPIFFWLSLFFISLFPTLTPLGISWMVAERYVYLGSIGIFVVIAILIDKLNKISPIKNLPLAIFFILIIPALMTRTIIRNKDWQNQDTLWLAAAKTSPSSHQNHNNLGDLYARQGKLEKAVEEFKKAIALKPNYADAYHNLGNIYQQMNKIDQAIESYQKAIKFNPNLWQSYQNLGGIYFNQKKYDLAREMMEKATLANPKNSNILINLGVIYLRLGKGQKGKEAFQKALQIDPQNQRARQALLSIE